MTAVASHRLARQREGRLVAGVCAGIARSWRLDISVVRFSFLALTIAGGAGAVLYVVLWLVLPTVDAPAEPAPRVDPRDDLAALAMVAGSVLVLRSAGVWFTDVVAVVGGLAAVGVTLVWGGADRPEALRSERGGALRIAVGVVLLAAGFVAFVWLTGSLADLGPTLLAAVVAGAGVVLLAGPRLVRLFDELDAERRARVRVEERAEIAAHLHDGVLQTLALIQRRAGDNREVATLARRQERELREWLYGTSTPSHGNLAGALAQELAAVEDDHRVRVELVCVGDTDLDDDARVLVAAVREATTNAARHAGVEEIDVYVEVEDERFSAYVRDRGRGFDPAMVPADRRGLADSVIGRVERAGGTARVKSRPGEGTEVALTVPRRRS